MNDSGEPREDRDYAHHVLLRVLSEDPDSGGVIRRVVEAIGRGTFADRLDTATVQREDTGEEYELSEPTTVEHKAFRAMDSWRLNQIKGIESSLRQLLMVPLELWDPEENGELPVRDGEHDAGASSPREPDRATVNITDEEIEETIRKIRGLVDAPEWPAPDRVYTALVVRDVVVRTPCSATIGGIPARSSEEARARAKEAARWLPEPPINLDDDTETRWSIGDELDPELGPPKVVEVFEEAAADNVEPDQRRLMHVVATRSIGDRVDALPERELISGFLETEEIERFSDGDDAEGTLDAKDSCHLVREQCQAHERELSEHLVEPTTEEASSVEP